MKKLNLSRIEEVKNFEHLKKILKAPDNFSLNKFFKDNKLYSDDQLNLELINNIKEMMYSKIIENLFNQYINFKDYLFLYF